MGSGSRIGRLGFALALVGLIAALVPASSGASKKSPFEPGLYTGKTSQGYAVKLRLVVADEPCSGHPCLSSPSNEADIELALACRSIGETTNEVINLLDGPVTKTGNVSVDEKGFAKTIGTIKVAHNGTLAGKLRSTETLEDGARCDSGPVTLSARLK